MIKSLQGGLVELDKDNMTLMQPKYVVITPVRDEENYIRFTIQSMINQTLRPQEWIIVDDGSTDKTRQHY